MSEGTSGKDTSRTPHKERIIPIKIEEDESVISSTTSNTRTPSLRSRRGEHSTPKETPSKQKNVKMEPQNEDSNSEDESNVQSMKSLSIDTDKQKDSCDLIDLSLDDIPQRSLPTYNVPEKIIIVLDKANDENCTNFEMTSGKKYSPLFMLQHALQIFLYNKSFIDNKHEFALISLNENSATWIHDFTNAPQDIIASIQALTEFPCEPEDIFDLDTVFDIVNKKIELSPPNKDSTPLGVVRMILLYGRSYSIPQLTKTDEIEKLINSPYFTVDVIMTHEPPDSANHCDRIFKALQEIDTKGFAYSFSVSRNALELHCAMAKILSHPLQRPHQLSAKYELNLPK